MIEVSDLYKSFDQNHVLKGVNLKVDDGKSMVIIGASGQGKSVILKCLLGLSKPNSGRILLHTELRVVTMWGRWTLHYAAAPPLPHSRKFRNVQSSRETLHHGIIG